MRRLFMFAGLCSLACGTFLILMLYGFASMTVPDIEGAAGKLVIWRKVISDGLFPVGIVLIVAGIWLASRKPKRRD